MVLKSGPPLQIGRVCVSIHQVILKKPDYYLNNINKFLLSLAQFLTGYSKPVFMKRSLLLFSFLIITLCLQAQRDTVTTISRSPKKTFVRDASNAVINIYPVPVRENSFTIKTDRDISNIKVTNMIGQDIFRAQFNNPQPLTRVLLENPRRGIYLVTIGFVDGTRVVKKIMVEESE